MPLASSELVSTDVAAARPLASVSQAIFLVCNPFVSGSMLLAGRFPCPYFCIRQEGFANADVVCRNLVEALSVETALACRYRDPYVLLGCLT